MNTPERRPGARAVAPTLPPYVTARLSPGPEARNGYRPGACDARCRTYRPQTPAAWASLAPDITDEHGPHVQIFHLRREGSTRPVAWGGVPYPTSLGKFAM